MEILHPSQKKLNVSHMFRSTMNKYNTVSIEYKSFSYAEVQSKSMTLRTNAAFILCNTNFIVLRLSILNDNNSSFPEFSLNSAKIFTSSC